MASTQVEKHLENKKWDEILLTSDCFKPFLQMTSRVSESMNNPWSLCNSLKPIHDNAKLNPDFL
jgi:hypothetical protein